MSNRPGRSRRASPALWQCPRWVSPWTRRTGQCGRATSPDSPERAPTSTHMSTIRKRLKWGRNPSHRARRGGRRARRTLVCGPARKKKETSTMAEKAGSVERRAGRSPSRRAQRSDFTLSQLNRAVIRLPPHAQEPLDDRVDVETRASHLRLVSRASVYPFKPKAESLRRSPVLGSAGFPATTACPHRRANMHGMPASSNPTRTRARGASLLAAARSDQLARCPGRKRKLVSTRTGVTNFYWLARDVRAKGQDSGRNFENLPTESLQPTKSATSLAVR